MKDIDEDLWANLLASEGTDLSPPASVGDISAFEESHGISLPPDHRALLLRANGGTVGSVRLFGVNRPDHLDLGRQVSEMRPYIEGMADGPIFPFASDWGGSYFCYDLRRAGVKGSFPVLFWDHEYSEEPDDRPMLWSEFAPDFMGFLQSVISNRR